MYSNSANFQPAGKYVHPTFYDFSLAVRNNERQATKLIQMETPKKTKIGVILLSIFVVGTLAMLIATINKLFGWQLSVLGAGIIACGLSGSILLMDGD